MDQTQTDKTQEAQEDRRERERRYQRWWDSQEGREFRRAVRNRLQEVSDQGQNNWATFLPRGLEDLVGLQIAQARLQGELHALQTVFEMSVEQLDEWLRDEEYERN